MVKFKFILIDKGCLYTLLKTKSTPDIVFFANKMGSFILIYFLIRVKVSYRILIFTSSIKTYKYIIYDGPLLELDILHPLGKNEFISSTFQCILGLFRNDEEQSDLFTDEQYFNYSAVFHSEYTTIMIKESKIIDLPFRKCAKNICVLNIATSLNYSLNATVLRIKTEMSQKMSCLYHGLSIVNEKEYVTFCGKKAKRNSHRSIYSERSQLWMILYWYKEYNTINARVSLSTTKCRFVIFDPCEFVSSCFSIGANCPSHLEKVTKNTKLNFERTQSWEPEVVFSLPHGECVVLIVRLSSGRSLSLLEVKYHTFPFCLCCVSIISEPGKNQIRSVRGKLLFNRKHKITSFIKVVGTKLCLFKNCERIFGGEEIRNYKLLKKRGYIWIQEQFQEIHGLKVQIIWESWKINWLEVVLTALQRHKPSYSGFTEEAKIFVQIGYLLGKLMMPRDVSGIDMVLSMESKSSSDIPTRYFSGVVANARYLIVDGFIFTRKLMLSVYFAQP